ncbi:MAG: peptidylprolyl isomerase, partial [Ignavibacteriaceae bacterium]|nr:peptidylprolyl isomerase [Ignavibacteriaceae bacterium]
KNLQTLFITTLLILFLSINTLAQTGMPQYNIMCEREGTYIGDIKVELFRIITPLHVHNFDSLVSIQFYDTTAFHRVVPGFVIQGGDPNSRHGDPSTWGYGDPTQTTVPAEFTNINHARGILGAARDSDINSATSQFFINVADNSSLNGQYTAYGRVYEGMTVVDDIVNSPVVPGTERPVQKIEMFVTYLGVNDSVPDAPDLISPVDGLEDVLLTQSFQWAPVQSAVLYRFQLSTDSNFTTIEYDDVVGAANYWVGGLQLGFVKYYWRVQANNGGNISSFSEVRSFTTGIDIPILISPPDSAVNVSTSPTFEWTPVYGAVSYTLQISTFGSFFNFVVNQSGITSTSYSVNGLEENKKLYWRVRGATANYEGLFSQVFRFTTGSTSSVNDNDNIYTYNLEQNYPNPFNPVTVIKYQLAKPGFVTISIYNILGMEIAKLVKEEKSAGSYEVEYGATHLPSGIYFYRLQAGPFVETKKMVLMK